MARLNSFLSNNNGAYAPNNNTKVHEYSEEIAQLKSEIERLDMITQAMWKLLQAKGLSDEDLIKAITEIDNEKKQKKKALEEGEKPETILCPNCHVPLQNSGKITDRCIYCGHEIITSPFKI